MKNIKPQYLECPDDTCPLDLIANLGERTRNSRIYLGEKAIERLKSTCNKHVHTGGSLSIFFNASKSFPSTELLIKMHDEEKDGYFEIRYIKAEDIPFEEPSSNPNEIFKIEMKEA